MYCQYFCFVMLASGNNRRVDWYVYCRCNASLPSLVGICHIMVPRARSLVVLMASLFKMLWSRPSTTVGSTVCTPSVRLVNMVFSRSYTTSTRAIALKTDHWGQLRLYLLLTSGCHTIHEDVMRSPLTWNRLHTQKLPPTTAPSSQIFIFSRSRRWNPYGATWWKKLKWDIPISRAWRQLAGSTKIASPCIQMINAWPNTTL